MYIVCSCVCVCVAEEAECLGKSSTTELHPRPTFYVGMSLKRGHKLMEEELSQRFIGAETETQNLCNLLEH